MGNLDRDRRAKQKLNYVGEPKATWKLEPTTFIRTAEQKVREQERSEELDRIFEEKMRLKRKKVEQ